MRIFGRFRRRVLVHGVVVVLLMAGAVGAADRLFVNRWIEQEMEERLARVNSKITIYGLDGDLVASNTDPPVPSPPPEVVARFARGAPPATVNGAIVSGLFRDGAFKGVVVRKRAPPMEGYPGPPIPVTLLALVLCMALTLIVSIPLSRAVVQPVERLARSVKRFGAGELNARASLSREDEIGELAAAFDEMAARIQALVRSEKRLLASVSHELRTPLARIRVILELATDGDPHDVRSYLGEIAQDLAELESLVEDVLTSAKLDAGSGALPMHWTHASITDLIATSRARFARAHPDQRFDAHVDVRAAEIECDPKLLRRAIDNLLDNAAKHAPSARVELRVHEDDGIVIAVTDDGPGMSAAAAALAFEPFFREDVSRDRRTGGSGLGLSIVRTIVEAHGGRVVLDSAPTRGTRVAIHLPRREASTARGVHGFNLR